MDDIAERAGVSKPVLYQHFPSKLDLYLALLDQACDQVIEGVRGALAATDANAERVTGTTEAFYAYVADGHNGLRILQLTDPETSVTYAGFSPRPDPKLIATFRTTGPAVALSKGLDRDRAVDESGNQLAVFGRRGARPFNLAELQRMYLMGGKLYTVTDNPTTPANEFKGAAAKGAGDQPEAKPEKAVSANSVSSHLSIFTFRKMTGTTKLIGGGLGLWFVGLGLRRVRFWKRRA